MKNTKSSLRGCLKLKNGNVREFVDHIHYGDELWFIYDGKKYFLEGWTNNDILELCLYEMSDNGNEYIWKGDTLSSRVVLRSQNLEWKVILGYRAGY